MSSYRELILADAAKIARTTPDALRGAINRKRLVARKVGPLWVVAESDLYDYLESKRTWIWSGVRPQRTTPRSRARGHVRHSPYRARGRPRRP